MERGAKARAMRAKKTPLAGGWRGAGGNRATARAEGGGPTGRRSRFSAGERGEGGGLGYRGDILAGDDGLAGAAEGEAGEDGVKGARQGELHPAVVGLVRARALVGVAETDVVERGLVVGRGRDGVFVLGGLVEDAGTVDRHAGGEGNEVVKAVRIGAEIGKVVTVGEVREERKKAAAAGAEEDGIIRGAAEVAWRGGAVERVEIDVVGRRRGDGVDRGFGGDRGERADGDSRGHRRSGELGAAGGDALAER